MKLFYATVLLLFTITTAFSQKDFRKGYIILKSDTLHGYLDYRGDVRNAQQATFKASLSEEAKAFSPEEITGYGFPKEGKIYESRFLPVADSADAELKHIFAHVLVKGKATLLFYRDQAGIDHYYLQKDSVLTKLTNHNFRKADEAGGKTYDLNYKKYIGLLTFAFSDCPTLSATDLKHVSLSQRSLVKITNKYNQCMSTASPDKAPQKGKAKITFAPVVLNSSAKVKFEGEENLKKIPLENKVNIGAGLSLNVMIPSWNEKLSLQTELLYTPYKFEGSYTSPQRPNYRYEAYFDVAYLKLPLQLRYTLPKGTIRPFMNAGLVVGYAVKTDNQYTAESLTNSNYTYSYDAVFYKKALTGVTAGAGISSAIKGHTITLEGRYEMNNGLSEHINLGSSMNNFNILVSFSL